ncbi:MAG: carbohydrate kinase [Spirochaetes bacterium]|nr:carbohydrate kinase [Spirochaetota bacterium]
MPGDLPLILAIDVGTSTVKGALVDGDGRIRTISTERVADRSRAVSVWDRDQRHDAIVHVMRELGPLTAVDVVVVSGHGPTLVPIDADGEPLEPVLLWNDGRERRVSEQPSFFLPKAAWLLAERPDVYERTRHFLSLPEYIDYLLTGEVVAITPTDEFIQYIWNADAIAAYGLDPDLFPPFVHTGDRIGVVQAPAAERYGLRAGTPVVAGGSDFLMSLIGTASLAPGRTCDRAGTSEGINYCSRTPVADPRLRTLPHLRAGMYNVAAILESTGSAFEWFRGITGQQDNGYVHILEDIRSADSDAPLFIPSPRGLDGWNFKNGAFLELNAHHGPAELGRAVVESLGFTIRHSLEVLAEVGCEVNELRICGGQAKNPVWNRMKADMSGVDVLVPEVEDAELVGNACCGLVGIGACDSLLEASDRIVHFRERISPEREAFERYGERYARYQEAVERLSHL